MKRIMNQKLVMIFGAVAVVMAVVFVVLGIFVTNSAKGTFGQDGYVLGEVYAEEGDASNNIYFNANSKYKSKYPNKISLKGEKGKSTISKYSFVHYSNNDLSSFSKGVFVNLDELSNENLNYYNIPAEALVKSSGKTYSFKVSNKEQRMSNFLWKIEKNKYMVVGTGVTAHIAEGKDKKLDGYVEFEYKDEGVVQLTHRDGTYQTISSDASIKLDNGAIIMLNDRSIYLGEDKKLSLDQMVINSNDNINVDEEEEDKTTTNNTTNNSSSTTISGGGGSGGGTTPTETINFPEFAVTSMDVGLVSVAAQIEITDDDDLLSEDGVTVAIYERGTSKKVWEKTVQKGQYQISVNTDGLNPDKEYILAANSDYEFKGEKYNKDFVSQLFRTNATGIRMTKSSVDSNKINMNIAVKEYSEITTGKVELVNNKTGVAEKSEAINLAEIKTMSDGKEWSFSGLESNTEYTIVLTDLYTGASVLTKDNDIEKVVKTLKTTPELGLPEVTVNRSGKAFSLYLTSESGVPVVDDDDGINKMVFEIYEATQVVDGEITGDPVYSAESKKTSGVSVKLDDTNLKRNVKYVYRAVAIFDDNEKIIECCTPFSSVFTMTSATYPSVIFTPQDVTTSAGVKKEGVEHDSFRGVVTIYDDGDVVVRPNIITYSITGNDGGDVQLKQWDVSENGELSTPIEVTGLRSNTTYTVTFMGMADLDDGNDPMKIYLGSFQVTTKEKPDAVKAEVQALKTTDESFKKYAFNANIYLGESYTPSIGAEQINPAYEMSTMNSLQLVMYKGVDDGSGNITKGDEWARKNVTNAASSVDPINYTYNSTLRGLFSKSAETPYEINPSTFGMSNAQVTSDAYVLEIRNAVDYTDFSNSIEIIGDDNKVAEFIIQKHGFVPNLPANINDSINVTEVLFGDMQEEAGKTKYKEIANSGAADASLHLKSDTIVGYSVKALSYPSNALKYAKNVTYKMYKLTNYVSQSQVDLSTAELVANTTKNVSSDASSLPAWEVPIKADTTTSRGNLYVFTYEVELNLAESGDPITANYPKDAVGATNSTVLRSSICPCPKETPNMYMYLKNSVYNSNSSKYDMMFRYKYVDTDNAYKVDPNNASSADSQFRIVNGTSSRSYTWDEDAGDGTKKIDLTGIEGGTKTLSILKKVSHYDPIANYTGSVTEEEYTVQPMSHTRNAESSIQLLKFHMDKDVSNLKIVIDSDTTSSAQLSKIAAIKATLKCDGTTMVFDYLTLDDNNTAFIPLIRVADFKKKEITVSVTAYYENDELGTDLASRSGSAYPVVLEEYTRVGGYQYINGTLKDSLYLVNQDYGAGVLSGTLSAVKYFEGKKLKNVNAQTGYTGETAQEFKYTVDSQGLDTNLTGNNYKIDSYYITRRVDTTSIAPVTQGANKITFNYIRPIVKNDNVEPGVTDATITFDYVGKDKSTLKDNKLYLVVSDTIAGLEDYNDPNKTYEITLTSSSDQKNVSVAVGRDGHPALTKGKTYYYAIYGKFEDGSTVETLKLLTESGDEFIGGFSTLGDVGFSAISYSYSSTSYGLKSLMYKYTLKVVTGFYVTYELKDVATGQVIDLGSYANTTSIMPTMTLALPVGSSNTNAIPGRTQLVYGHKYTLTARAYTSSTDESVGSKSTTFTLTALPDPTITATMIAKQVPSGGVTKNYVSSTLVVRDSRFSIVNGAVKVSYYSGRVADTAGKTPIKEENFIITNNTTYKALTLGYNSTDPVLQDDAEYTMVVETQVDNKYIGTNFTTLKKYFYVKTLNTNGIGYSDIFAKSNDGGSVIVEFYDVQGFEKVSSMDYTIFANTLSGVDPISGNIPASKFVKFGVNNVSRRVTIDAGLKTNDRYTIVMQLLDDTGKILAQESRSFSY